MIERMFVYAKGDEGAHALSALSTEEVENEIASLAAEIAASMCRWLELIAEFERRKGHLEAGFHRCADWLAYRCSLSRRTARDHMRVARRLGELPKVREAFAAGELSYSKVRTIARVARTPEMEDQLLEMARCATAGQLERISASCAGALSRDQANKNYANRHFSWEWDEDGTLAVRGRFDGEEGALLLRALDAGCRALRREAGLEEGAHDPSQPASPTNADALLAMAESLLASGPVTRASAERNRVVVHVDAAVLAEGACQLEDGPAISAETARRLSCDAPAAITAGSDQESDRRRSRAIPAAVRRAVRIRDDGCRFPGCENRHWVDAHHIVHWAHGGESTTENLVQLCRRHHRLIHEGGFGVEHDAAGELIFRRPRGDMIEPVPGLPRARQHGSRKRLRGAAVGVHALMPEPIGRGESFDLDLAVTGLCRVAGPGS
jgi:uncharacterized protein DUF222/HNH endonuclease